ncbi:MULTISPECIES: hypothetical protein [Flavobacterium]|uniref:Phage protein n=1 Tax=Flavobacterium keumense TaxID=1306518 RepID=A0ABY8N374_9FLAO|nr:MULTISPECIES: hypothetical protein [Flavobacterium]WGK93829.1 hypothetical protein MG292_06920 [Flavobacterium keumense]
MKNIHVLSTDKPSRLQLQMNGNFHIENGQTIALRNYINIYITSNKEIKEGDYGLVVNEILSYNKMIELWGVTQGWKIILTTDQDLIKDDVQAIDDEFLEWFVKNPSCEGIEVKLLLSNNGRAFYGYRIIIPKEEPKQETLEEYDAESYLAGIKSDLAQDYWCKQQERRYSEEDMNEYADYVLMCSAEKTFKLPLPPKEWFKQFKNK